MNRISSEDAFEICLEMLEGGSSIEHCLQRFPQFRAELAPMLRMATVLNHVAEPPALTRDQALNIARKSFTQLTAAPAIVTVSNKTKSKVRTLKPKHILRVAAVLMFFAAIAFVLVGLFNEDNLSGSTVVEQNNTVENLSTTVIEVAAFVETETTIRATATEPRVNPTKSPTIDAVTSEALPATNTPTVSSTPSIDAITSHPTEIETSEPQLFTTNSVTPPPLDATANIETVLSTTSTPELSETTQAPMEIASAAAHDADEAFPIVIDIVGEIESYDATTRTLVVDGVTVMLDIDTPLSLPTGRLIEVSGTFTTDGIINANLLRTVDILGVNDCNDSVDLCRGLDEVLQTAFGLSEGDINELLDEYTYSDIVRAYTLSYALGTVRPASVLQARALGLSWEAILEQYSAEMILSAGVLLGDGSGNSIQNDPASTLLVFNLSNAATDETSPSDEGEQPPTDEPHSNFDSVNDSDNDSLDRNNNSGNGNGPPDTPPGLDDNPRNGNEPPDTPPGLDDNPGNGNEPPGQSNRPN